MRENIQKASQRGEDLDALQDKTDGLHTSAQGFRKGANRVRKHMWWKDTKMKICLIIGIIILIVVIVVPSGMFIPYLFSLKSFLAFDEMYHICDWLFCGLLTLLFPSLSNTVVASQHHHQ